MWQDPEIFSVLGKGRMIDPCPGGLTSGVVTVSQIRFTSPAPGEMQDQDGTGEVEELGEGGGRGPGGPGGVLGQGREGKWGERPREREGTQGSKKDRGARDRHRVSET